jgi:hypothetical protein
MQSDQLATNLQPSCMKKCILIRFIAEKPQIIELKCTEKHFSDETGNVQTHVAFFHTIMPAGA